MDGEESIERPKPRCVECMNEILKKKGLSHTALQNICGRMREAQLLGRDSKDPRTNRAFVDPDGFPNSYVRGCSERYLRVGVHVEPARDAGGSGIAKGIQLYSYAEPIIPEGSIAFSGPITFRIVENEGRFREFVKDLNCDGSRRDWGTVTLHAKPVTLPKAQTAASGIIESGTAKAASGSSVGGSTSASESPLGLVGSTSVAFSDSNIHKGGYQAIELIRIANLTPLLWVRVVLEEVDEVDMKEDGEYRVRSAVITTVASSRAKDAMTPPFAIKFLETANGQFEKDVLDDVAYVSFYISIYDSKPTRSDVTLAACKQLLVYIVQLIDLRMIPRNLWDYYR